MRNVKSWDKRYDGITVGRRTLKGHVEETAILWEDGKIEWHPENIVSTLVV